MQLGAYLCIGIGFMVALISLINSRRHQLAIVVLIIASLVAIWIASARGAMLTVIGMAVVYIMGCILLSNRQAAKWAAIVSVISIVGVSAVAVPLALYGIPNRGRGENHRCCTAY